MVASRAGKSTARRQPALPDLAPSRRHARPLARGARREVGARRSDRVRSACSSGCSISASRGPRRTGGREGALGRCERDSRIARHPLASLGPVTKETCHISPQALTGSDVDLDDLETGDSTRLGLTVVRGHEGYLQALGCQDRRGSEVDGVEGSEPVRE